MIRYADDFILLGKRIPKELITQVEYYLSKMELRINDSKTKLIDAKSECFDFLGFRFRWDRSLVVAGTKYWNIIPKPESEKKLRMKISRKLKKTGHFKVEALVKELNPILNGWINYYKLS